VLIASCSSRCVHRVVLIASGSSCRAHRVVSYLPTFLCFRHSAMLRASKTAAMDVMLGACAGNAKCGSSIYRCTLDIENRTGLSHYAWNPLRVCECDGSICCDVLCLDSQRNHGAMTRVVRMPFALTRLRPEGKSPSHGCVQKENALTRLRPEGKCPDTVCPERKCPATLRPVSKCHGVLRPNV